MGVMADKTHPADYATFENALKGVLQVSHSEMKAKLDAEKQEKKQPKKRPFGHASGAKD